VIKDAGKRLPRRSKHWLKTARAKFIRRDPLEVVLLGLLGSDPSFHQAVRDALGFLANEHVRYLTIQETVLDQTFASAFGAARGAKRVFDIPQPRGSEVENPKCSLVREEVLSDSLIKRSVREVHFGEL
jgi:hypothetical protein